MPSTLTIVTILPAAGLAAAFALVRRSVHGTTLTLAATWGLVASLAVLSGWLSSAVFAWLASPWDDIAWYGIAILVLCPPIAVLGARRPGVAAWNGFVLLPLIAVLGWPAIAVILSGARPGSFSLEAPPLIGLLLVLVMGTGNYAGTRYAPAAALVFGAVVLLAASLAPQTRWPLTPVQSRGLAVWGLGAAALLAQLVWRRRNPDVAGPDRVWRDFRDQFGIVWAHRIRERVNAQALQEKWPIRLEPSGFVPVDPKQVICDSSTQQSIERTLRWLLRRFVSDAWMDVRLKSRIDTPHDGKFATRELDS